MGRAERQVPFNLRSTSRIEFNFRAQFDFTSAVQSCEPNNVDILILSDGENDNDDDDDDKEHDEQEMPPLVGLCRKS